MSAVRDAWALRSMALRAVIEGREYDAGRLWREADRLFRGEVFRYVASRVQQDGSVYTWTVETCHLEEWIDLDVTLDWTQSASFSSKEAFKSWRLCSGLHKLGTKLPGTQYAGHTLWVQTTEEQEERLAAPTELLEALVGRCEAEGVGASWAPLRDAKRWLEEGE